MIIWQAINPAKSHTEPPADLDHCKRPKGTCHMDAWLAYAVLVAMLLTSNADAQNCISNVVGNSIYTNCSPPGPSIDTQFYNTQPPPSSLDMLKNLNEIRLQELQIQELQSHSIPRQQGLTEVQRIEQRGRVNAICRNDIKRYCARAPGSVKDCMLANVYRLDTSCRAALVEYVQSN